MRVERISPRTGEVNHMDLPITEEQYNAFLSGESLHKAFPNLNADEREFILTGYTKEDWAAIFPPGEDDDDDEGDHPDDPELREGPEIVFVAVGVVNGGNLEWGPGPGDDDDDEEDEDDDFFGGPGDKGWDGENDGVPAYHPGRPD